MLYLLVELLPTRLQDRAKALAAGAVSALVAVVATGLLTGEWDKGAIAAAVVALLTGGATFGTPNAPRPVRELAGDETGDAEDSPKVATTGRPVSEIGSRGSLEPPAS